MGRAGRQEALEPLAGFGPYGSAAGQPCDFDFCGCEQRTPEAILRMVSDYPYRTD